MPKRTHVSPMDASPVDRLNALLPRANAGDHAAREALQAVLDEAPDLWLEVGNLGRHAELALVRSAAGDDPIAKEAIVRTLDTLRREVAGVRPSVLERLLADRVVITWLALSVAEGSYHQTLEQAMSEAAERMHQQRIERAQRRYLAAIKTLAQVRRMDLPTLQVNIGEKQVNVAGASR